MEPSERAYTSNRRSKGYRLREVCNRCGRGWKAHWPTPSVESSLRAEHDKVSMQSANTEGMKSRKSPKKFTKLDPHEPRKSSGKFTKPDPHEGAEKPASRSHERNKVRESTERCGEL